MLYYFLRMDNLQVVKDYFCIFLTLISVYGPMLLIIVQILVLKMKILILFICHMHPQ